MKITVPTSVLFAVSMYVAQALAAGPSVKLSYADFFDEVCVQQTKYKIDPSWKSELATRLPEFESAWARDGSTLLETSVAIVGKSFTENEILVPLSICSFPSMGEPLLVNMRYSLNSFTPTPLSMDVTVSTIFHELLHRFLGGKIPVNSKLLLKYEHEDETVKFHLHLFALQKAVYLKLGREDTLKRVVQKDQALPNKSYKRAWEIVNDLDNYSAFIRELHQ